ncbi:MAG TPA: plastocyanin/azurin family copper-binding protein [Candidatus Acidoferrales bacterium]|nr:plastocyanin/azurin family copper-binding protein [Candidatus Acidoferrales bacterium]
MRIQMLKINACAGLFAIALSVAIFSSIRLARATEEQAPATKITTDNFSFTPKETTVTKGTTITWVNHDDVPHTVVNTDKRFKSNALDTDDQFSFTFTESGTYAYFCSVHPLMTGKVIVK